VNGSVPDTTTDDENDTDHYQIRSHEAVHSWANTHTQMSSQIKVGDSKTRLKENTERTSATLWTTFNTSEQAIGIDIYKKHARKLNSVVFGASHGFISP
jgi:hypothetical protein